MKNWIASGKPWIWLTAGAVAICVLMVVGLLGMITVRGMVHFWPADIQAYQYQDPNNNGEIVQVVGELRDKEEVSLERIRESGVALESSSDRVTRYLVKVGNRDIGGSDFRWIIEPLITGTTVPQEIVVVERREWGNLHGELQQVKVDGAVVAEGAAAWNELQKRIAVTLALRDTIRDIEKVEIGAINYSLEQLRLKKRKLELDKAVTPETLSEIKLEEEQLHQEYEGQQNKLHKLYEEINRATISVKVSTGKVVDVTLANIVRAYQPNKLSLFSKIIFYFEKVWEFLSDEPREANTEGGIFPAIFGTVMMVIIMSMMATPFGVIAAIYLREYAKQGFVTRTIRIAVNNLAGVPAIVYGVFGLGFFVYFLGGSIDALFYPEAAPAPVFGTPGLLWASITLSLLTVPVVIVATEEGLTRIPRSIREGSLALGATKAETLWRTIIPMASPAIMTGMILAIARAAGEVAPLMLVGVVKLAPSLPLDGNFPFVHLDRKFMHLGFHIYDVGFQSPNVEAARPLVYATALLLVIVIVVLNLAAIAIRNRLREKYKALEN
jgi:phosphate transport system permease protein